MAKMIIKKNIADGMEIEDYVFSVTQQEAAKIEMPLEKKRVRMFMAVIAVAITILGARIFYLNVMRGPYYQRISKGNSIRSIVINAPRGRIYDSQENALVTNIPSIDVIAIPGDLPQDHTQIESMAGTLAQILSLNEGEILAKLESSDKQSLNALLLKEDISQDESLKLLEQAQQFPGIMVSNTAIRNYTQAPVFPHVLGYVGKLNNQELKDNPNYLLTDYIGKNGIEKSYEKYLRGVNGAVQVEVDSRGNIKKERGVINPEAGYDITLSIDGGLQKKIYDSLNIILQQTKTKTAAAVAINPQNGQVLALVSLPSFDNNLFTHKITSDEYASLMNDPDKPMFDRAVSGQYPPGSTLKPAIALAALTEGTITQNTTVNDSAGVINVGAWHFGDWKAHGVVNVKQAIAESCDVFFYSVGGGYGNIPGLGMDRMKKYEDSLGLGQETGIDLPGEEPGLIPDEQWKLDSTGEKWYIGDSYHAAIGQGYVTLTPLQLASYISAIANGGKLYQPHIVSQIKKNDGSTIDIQPKIYKNKIISDSALKVVQEGMRETILSGTAQSLKTLPVAVAGKTGTAQFGSENKTHAWFVSYAPFDNPQIALAVLVEGGGEGNSSALPVTKDVYSWYFGPDRKQ